MAASVNGNELMKHNIEVEHARGLVAHMKDEYKGAKEDNMSQVDIEAAKANWVAAKDAYSALLKRGAPPQPVAAPVGAAAEEAVEPAVECKEEYREARFLGFEREER